MRTLLIGFTVPDETIKRICAGDCHSPMQTHNFAWSVVQALESADVTVDLLSSEPVSLFPGYPQIFFGYTSWTRPQRTWNVLMPFINLIGLRHIFRFLSTLFIAACWLARFRREANKTILVHGVHSAYLVASCILKRLTGTGLVAILTDPPGVPQAGEGVVWATLRRVDTALVKSALKRFDGVVSLTPQLARDLAASVPSLVVEGILPSPDRSESELKPSEGLRPGPSPFVALYAGGLLAEYGVQLLLQAFLLLANTRAELWLLGKGPLLAEVHVATKQNPRVRYLGFLSPRELAPILRHATVLLNPRPSAQAFTPYSFPSKLLTYMASGRPVLTTRLPGIPREYFPYLYFLDDESPEGLARELTRLSRLSGDELSAFGSCARNFVLQEKTAERQGCRLACFLGEVALGRAAK